jgi:hypothetical protein
MLNPTRILVILLFSANLLVCCNGVNADVGVTNDPAVISIDVENGVVSSSSILFSGIIEDEILPSEVYWRVVKNGIEFDGGDLGSELVEMDSSSNRLQWAWEFELSYHATGECSCYVSVNVHDAEGEIIRELRVVFMIQSTSDTNLMGLLIHDPPSGQYQNEIVAVSGWAGVYFGGDFHDVEISIKQSLSNHFSASTIFPYQSEDASLSSSLHFESGDFSINESIIQNLDGWYKMEVTLLNGMNTISNSFSIKVNNEPPVIKIEGIEYIDESNELYIFDASDTEDPYWGNEELYFVWTLRRPSHSGEVPIDVQMGIDVNKYTISGAISGNYTLSLTVFDKGGQSSSRVSSFSIANLPPSVKLSINGENVTDGQVVKLSDSASAMLEAFPLDTENDVSELRCIWLFDNLPLYEGCNRNLDWPDESKQRGILTIEIIDDDGETASMGVELIHPDAVDPLPIALIGLVISSLVLIYSVFRRVRLNDEPKIPKWKL